MEENWVGLPLDLKSIGEWCTVLVPEEIESPTVDDQHIFTVYGNIDLSSYLKPY